MQHAQVRAQVGSTISFRLAKPTLNLQWVHSKSMKASIRLSREKVMKRFNSWKSSSQRVNLPNDAKSWSRCVNQPSQFPSWSPGEQPTSKVQSQACNRNKSEHITISQHTSRRLNVNSSSKNRLSYWYRNRKITLKGKTRTLKRWSVSRVFLNTSTKTYLRKLSTRLLCYRKQIWTLKTQACVWSRSKTD